MCGTCSTKQPSTLTCIPVSNQNEGLLQEMSAGAALAAGARARHRPALSTGLSQGAAEGQGLTVRAMQPPLAPAALLTALRYSSSLRSLSEHPSHSQWV